MRVGCHLMAPLGIELASLGVICRRLLMIGDMPAVKFAALLAGGGLLGHLDTLGARAAAGQEIQPGRMASNTSQRKAQTIILAAKVSDYRDWWLTVDCGSCGPRDVPLATLLPDQTISQVLRRLRCRSCRGEVASAALSNGLPGWQGRRIRVWGPGSYG